MSDIAQAQAGYERSSQRSVEIIFHLIGLVLAFMALAPLLWMVSMAFKSGDEVFGINLIPARPTLDNFLYVFTSSSRRR